MKPETQSYYQNNLFYLFGYPLWNGTKQLRLWLPGRVLNVIGGFVLKKTWIVYREIQYAGLWLKWRQVFPIPENRLADQPWYEKSSISQRPLYSTDRQDSLGSPRKRQKLALMFAANAPSFTVGRASSADAICMSRRRGRSRIARSGSGRNGFTQQSR